MKKYILCLVIILVFAPQVHANFVVYYDKSSKEVKFVGREKEIILSGKEKSKFDMISKSGKLSDYELTESIYDYKIINDNFVINTKKISNRENEKIKDKEDSDKKNADFESAKVKLMSATWVSLTSAEVDSLK